MNYYVIYVKASGVKQVRPQPRYIGLSLEDAESHLMEYSNVKAKERGTCEIRIVNENFQYIQRRYYI